MTTFIKTIVGAAAASLLIGAASADQVLKKHAEWKYWASKEAPAHGWMKSDFDDSKWQKGRVGIGYGDKDDKTLLTEMQNRFTHVYIRNTFKWPAKGGELYLKIRYDDGFIVYINGNRVLSEGMKTVKGLAKMHEANKYQIFKLSTYNLKEVNTIAIVGANRSLNSSDFSLDPYLVDKREKEEVNPEPDKVK